MVGCCCLTLGEPYICCLPGFASLRYFTPATPINANFTSAYINDKSHTVSNAACVC